MVIRISTIFKWRNSGGLRMLQSGGGFLLWGQFFRVGGRGVWGCYNQKGVVCYGGNFSGGGGGVLGGDAEDPGGHYALVGKDATFSWIRQWEEIQLFHHNGRHPIRQSVHWPEIAGNRSDYQKCNITCIVKFLSVWSDYAWTRTEIVLTTTPTSYLCFLIHFFLLIYQM